VYHVSLGGSQPFKISVVRMKKYDRGTKFLGKRLLGTKSALIKVKAKVSLIFQK
jgi:hypothetical protein